MPRRTLSHSDTSPSAARPAEPSPRAQSMPCTSSPAPGSNLPRSGPAAPAAASGFLSFRWPLSGAGPTGPKRRLTRGPDARSRPSPRLPGNRLAHLRQVRSSSPVLDAALLPRLPRAVSAPTRHLCPFSPYTHPSLLLAGPETRSAALAPRPAPLPSGWPLFG